MIKKVKDTIEKYEMIDEGDNLVIGVSGGIDSMALLDCLYKLKDDYKINIHVAHVNHGVRGEEAKKDQLFVQKIAEELELPYYTIDVDMDGYAAKNKISSEEAGRILRYGFFNDIISGLGSGKIVVGHNLNDQAETLIMRFMRGTGLEGLQGIEYKNENIIRPILGISRDELEKYIEENHIGTRLDRTNLESIYTRNKIRLEVIPYIEENFNPNIIDTLERTSNLARIDNQFLEDYSKDRYEDILLKETDEEIILSRDGFMEQGLSIKQRILRMVISNIKGDLQGITEIHISNLIDLYEKGSTGKRIDILDGLVGIVSYDELIISKSEEDKIKSFEEELKNGIILNGKYLFEFEILDKEEIDGFKSSPYVKYFDYDKIDGEILVRNRNLGDRFQPFGMKGSKKIKDYFIDEKIPRDKRDLIPLITTKNDIIWVVGYRISDVYKITDATERIIKIECSIL